MLNAQETRLSEAIEEAAREGRKRRSYFSFGDDGLTATVGAFGSLLRITKHFPGERIGLCVDHPDSPEPYQVEDRLQTLLSWSKRPFCEKVIGPHIDSLCHSHLSVEHTSMANDRWPTFHRKLKDGGNLKLQYVVSEGTIFQIFEMSGGQGNSPPPLDSPQSLVITPDLLIRDLDFIDENNAFNEAGADDRNVYAYDVRGNCLIRVHENVDRKAVLYIQGLDEQTSCEFDELDSEEFDSLYSYTDSESSENYYSEELSVETSAQSDSADESSRQRTDHESSTREDFVSEQSLSSGYTIRTTVARRGSTSENNVAPWLSSRSSLNQSSDERSHDTDELVNDEIDHDLSNLEVLGNVESADHELASSETAPEEPAGSAHSGEDPANEEPVKEEPVNAEPVTIRHGASGSYYRLRWKSTTNKPDVWKDSGHRPHRIILAYTLVYVSKDEEPIIPSMSWDTVDGTTKRLLTPWEPLILSDNQAIDLFLRRNLEHVLSVCSIPVPLERDEGSPAIALTCGDVDGHRVATAASL